MAECERHREPASDHAGQGDTPCLESAALAQAVWLKCESANPTGSHKDRMAAQLVSRARLAGATAWRPRPAATQVFPSPPTAAAGLQAEIAITRNCPTLQREAMQRFGAHLTAFDDSLAAGRTWPSYAATRRLRRHQLPEPAHGTHAYGVEGYKPIAREIFDHCGLPTDVIVPSARRSAVGRAAGLAGAAQAGTDSATAAHARGGALYACRAPCRPGTRAALGSGTDQYSIAGGTTTLQSLQALARSGGLPVEVSDAAAAQAQQRLERMGLATELSSAAALAAVTRLRRSGMLDAESSVVLILTSDGRRG